MTHAGVNGTVFTFFPIRNGTSLSIQTKHYCSDNSHVPFLTALLGRRIPSRPATHVGWLRHYSRSPSLCAWVERVGSALCRITLYGRAGVAPVVPKHKHPLPRIFLGATFKFWHRPGLSRPLPKLGALCNWLAMARAMPHDNTPHNGVFSWCYRNT